VTKTLAYLSKASELKTKGFMALAPRENPDLGLGTVLESKPFHYHLRKLFPSSLLIKARKSNRMGLNTVDLLVLTSLDQLLFKMKI
jgi:hypothetical protein